MVRAFCVFVCFALVACSGDEAAKDAGVTPLDAGPGLPDGGERADAGPGLPDSGEHADATPADAGAGGLALADFCAAFHGTLCDGMRDCGCALEGRRFDRATCDEVRIAECAASLQPYADAVAAGIIEFDGERAARCRDGAAALTASCTIVNERTIPIECAGLFRDRAALNDACRAPPGTPCASGAGVCDPTATCVASPGDGEPCIAGTCGAELFCNAVTDRCGPPLATGDLCFGRGCPSGEICRPDGTCGARLGDGDGPCRESFECAGGLACSGGICVAGESDGSACAGPNECASSLACVRSFANRSCADPLPAGGVCGESAECAASLICATQTCTTAPGLNAPCAESSEGLSCSKSYVCDTDDSRTCVEAPAQGEMCLIGSAICGPELGCDANNICIAPPGEGEPCTTPNNLCGEGLGCDFTPNGSICSPRRSEGESCQSHLICSAGLFCDFIEGAVCAPLRAEGESCAQGALCAPGLECSDLNGADRCARIPDLLGQACYDRCENALACLGAGGVCAPEICASP